MAPGPKKKSFLTPRHSKSNPSSKPKDSVDSKIVSKNEDQSDVVEMRDEEQKNYKKRQIESNWRKYEEPVSTPHADYARGSDIEVMLSYAVEAGSQLKLKEEKEWESDTINFKDISLNLEDIVNSMKCIPFHERINIKKYFNDQQISNFILSAEKWKLSLESKSEALEMSSDENKFESDPNDLLITEPGSMELNDIPVVTDFVVQDKTVDIINALTTNLTFKDTEKQSDEKASYSAEIGKDLELANNDLDFLLSLNISSKEPDKNVPVSKTSVVDDWLNSILDE